MARFQKLFGGLELAPNGFIKNAVIESLSKDPTNLVVGRIWFNTADKKYKCVVTETQKDANGNPQEVPVVKEFAHIDELQAFIDKLASTDAGKGSALVGYKGATGANGKFSVAAGTLEASLDSIVTAVDADKKDIADLQNKVTTSTDEIQSELDKVEAGAGLADDGSYKANANANYIKNATSLADADNKLDAALKAQADKEAQDIANLDKKVQDNYLSKTATEDQTVASNVEFKKAVVIDGDLVVKGATTEIETNQLKVGDNVITLNDDVPADKAPTENAGIEVNRGNQGVMPILIWDESDDKVKISTGKKDSNGNYILAPVATGGDADKIQAELDKAEAGAGLADDGSYKANANANYIKDATSLADADNKLDAALKAQADKEAKDVADLNTKTDNIQAELDKVEASAGLADDGSYKANVNANYIAKATSLADADNKLDAALKAQADKEAKDVADLNTKAGNIQAELDKTQAGAGLADDGSYAANTKANYIANATSLADADNKLDSAIKTVSDKADKNGSDITTLKTNLNNTRVVYEATDAATSFTIAHNLGSQMIDVMVWVYDDVEKKWYNDQVVVSVVDDNNIQVDLTSAAKIRATIVNVAFQF